MQETELIREQRKLVSVLNSNSESYMFEAYGQSTNQLL